MRINIPVRMRNPWFWVQVALSAFAAALAYMGLTGTEMTTWGAVWDVLVGTFTNPYCLFLVVCNIFSAFNDPTTKGLADSDQAMTYAVPKGE